jgi:N-acetylated-alpha-linked acidic dipeptidase
MSQLWGVTALRLANADLLPFNFASYAQNIRQFVNEMAKNNPVILSGAGSARSAVPAQSKDLASSLDLTETQKAIDTFEAAGKKLNETLRRKLSSGPIDPKLAATLNHGMMQVERNWLNPDGIPGRPWFKHILYGARFTYAHLELPGLTEAVEKQDWNTAEQQAEILKTALEKNTQLLDELNSTLPQ